MVNLNNQNMKSRFNLLLCEIHYPGIHGKTKDSAQDIDRHYLVFDKFDGTTGLSLSLLEDDEYYMDIESDIDMKIDTYCRVLNKQYSNMIHFSEGRFSAHPSIRNYHNIITRCDYIKPEIGQCVLLPSQELVAVLKTFWLRIIQRAWKKVCKERKSILMARRDPVNLSMREVKGVWPQSLRYLPGLKGLLSGL